MRAVVMIPVEKRMHLRNQARQIRDAIRPPTQAFLAQCSVEAFNIGLLILLVGAGNPMSGTMGTGLLGKGALELRAAISVQHGDTSCKAMGHGGPQKGGPVLTGQAGA